MLKRLSCGESEKRKGWKRKGLNFFSSPLVKGENSKGIAERRNFRKVLVIERWFI